MIGPIQPPGIIASTHIHKGMNVEIIGKPVPFCHISVRDGTLNVDERADLTHLIDGIDKSHRVIPIL
jgi:hypothetical protein